MLITDRITRISKDNTLPTRIERMITLPDSRQVKVTWMPIEVAAPDDDVRTLAWADDDHPPVRTPEEGPGRWFNLIPDTVTVLVGDEAATHTAVEVSSAADLKPGHYFLEPA